MGVPSSTHDRNSLYTNGSFQGGALGTSKPIMRDSLRSPSLKAWNSIGSSLLAGWNSIGSSLSEGWNSLELPWKYHNKGMEVQI
jgi:hypothetical protein